MPWTRRSVISAAALGGVAFSSPAARPQGVAKPSVSEGLTRYVADFIVKTTYAEIPSAALEAGRKSILDGIGLAFSGSVAETGARSRKYVASLGLVPGKATVIGSSMKVSPRFAALLNGIAIHADDYDDTQLALAKDRVYGLLTHPTAPALPPALAIAEAEGRSGRELILAYQIGVEVECKVAEAINPRHYGEGFHSTGTCGPIGSGAAVAKLRGLDRAAVARTIGIAASQGAGLRENFGTMTKPFHAGRAAEAGVVAADLVALGWTATDKILEAKVGFFQAAGGGFNAGAIEGKLGKPWNFQDPGVSIKPHPSGSLTHPGMTEILRLIKEHDIRPEDVERVDVGTNSYMPTALIHHRPTDELQAKFSMEFCMASCILYRKAGLQEFRAEVVNRPEVKAMIERVHFGVHPDAEAAGYNKMTTILAIKLRSGRTVVGRADFGKGSPANPMSFEEVAAKFLDCAAFAKVPAQKAKSIVQLVAKLEEVADLKTLTALLSV